MLKKVVHYMEQLAPLKLANLSWDNVGVLIEAPPRLDLPGRTKVKEEIMLTIDLTPSVLAECLQPNRWVSVIVAYHPLIFKPLTRLQLNDPKQSVVLGVIQYGISVYCPHTSLDACHNGSKLIDYNKGPAKRDPIVGVYRSGSS
jgi:putative NIF3 family GTP cyclohydrolase 1 type 2